MRPPLFVCSLTEAEQDELEEALRSEEAFTLRRAQIVRLSDRGKRAPEIAEDLGCSAQTVRNAIHEFNEEGLTGHVVSDETIRQAIQTMGHSWQRAKKWIRSPDPQYALKKSKETA